VYTEKIIVENEGMKNKFIITEEITEKIRSSLITIGESIDNI